MLTLLIYLIGSLLFYILFRKEVKAKFGEWLIHDRAVALFLSIFSWIGIIMFLLIKSFVIFIENSDKDAKW